MDFFPKSCKGVESQNDLSCTKPDAIAVSYLTPNRNPVSMNCLNWIEFIRSKMRPLRSAAEATRTAGSNAECRCDAAATSGCLID